MENIQTNFGIIKKLGNPFDPLTSPPVIQCNLLVTSSQKGYVIFAQEFEP